MSTFHLAQLSPHEERCLSHKPSFPNLKGPQQRKPPPGSPNRAPIERDAQSPEPSFSEFSKFLVDGPLSPVPPTGRHPFRPFLKIPSK